MEIFVQNQGVRNCKNQELMIYK